MTTTGTPTPTEQFAAATTLERQAEIVTETWILEAFTNRRGDLMQLLEDVEDTDGAYFWEHLAIAESLGADPDELELDADLHSAVVAAATATADQLPDLLIMLLLDEVGGLDEIRQWLPLPVINKLYEVLDGNTHTDVTKLVLEILIDAVSNKMMGY